MLPGGLPVRLCGVHKNLIFRIPRAAFPGLCGVFPNPFVAFSILFRVLEVAAECLIQQGFFEFVKGGEFLLVDGF